MKITCRNACTATGLLLPAIIGTHSIQKEDTLQTAMFLPSIRVGSKYELGAAPNVKRAKSLTNLFKLKP